MFFEKEIVMFALPWGVRRAACIGVAGVVAALGAFPALAQTTVTAVMHAPLRGLDPVINSQYIVRNYAYMVYDTLLARDAANKIRPQMAERWTVSLDGKSITFVLRDGLKWHDGTDVKAEDCVASIRRWSAMDTMGQVMNTLLEGMTVVDDKTFEMKFKEPTEIALTALSKPSGLAAFMMPKRLADTPVSEPIKEELGSGPFRLVMSDFKPGVQAVFEKFKDYVPRSEPASGMAGGKIVSVDRVKWVTMPDPMTAVNALLSKEIDLIEYVPYDLLSILEANPGVVVKESKLRGNQSIARLNFSQSPFDNKLLRQAALLAIDQKDQMQAQVGNPKYYKLCAAAFGCGGAYASDIGADKVIKGQPEKAAELLKQAKYDGAPVVILHATDVPAFAAMAPVVAQALRKAGFNVQMRSMDWQTVAVSRASRAPVTNGGWSIFCTINGLVDVGEPLGYNAASASGKSGYFGWPDVPAIEEARAKFARTKDPEELKTIATDLQRRILDEVLFIPLGEAYSVSAWRTDMAPPLDTPVAVFWNFTRTGK
ncbi:ABC transporter substrate-binding protein [Bradyrhizobium sp. WSM3983]|uniref:ABC transporter substrate-binding protein n=1 Tax=Bradyrhizobium sp. WSM3983 TaxID=1038867 RepID=UPI00041F07B4|nr:ABC transporter substrate-binding protein [Bradyrhizobium sp. WSM3983]